MPPRRTHATTAATHHWPRRSPCSPAGKARAGSSSDGILVVDDEPRLRDLAPRTLAQQGHTVTVAARSQEALALLQRRSFALVLSDYTIPHGDGLTLLAAVRADHPELPFILWGSAVPDQARRRAAALGAEVCGKAVGDALAALVDSTLPRRSRADAA